MATDKGYIAYVLEQLADLHPTAKPMFGEYGVYLDGKMVALVCDNNVFVKNLPETTSILGEDCETGYPYDGAKLHYVLDIDNRDLAVETFSLLARILPSRQPSKKK